MQLQHRYDALLASKERAAERYQADYKKWKRFKEFMCEEDDDFAAVDGQSSIDRKVRQMAAFLRKRKRFRELAMNYSPTRSATASPSSSKDTKPQDYPLPHPITHPMFSGDVPPVMQRHTTDILIHRIQRTENNLLAVKIARRQLWPRRK